MACWFRIFTDLFDVIHKTLAANLYLIQIIFAPIWIDGLGIAI